MLKLIKWLFKMLNAKIFESFDENAIMILHTTQKPLLRLTIGTSKKLKAIPRIYQNHIKMCIFYPSDSKALFGTPF